MTKDNEKTPETTPAAAPETADAPAPEQTLDAVHIIERFGGIRPMATKIDVAVTTVQGWKNRGVIPESRRDAIEAAAAEHGVDLTENTQASSSDEENAEGPLGVKTPVSSTPAAELSPPPPRKNNSGGGLAWIALVASLAALALASQPYWGPRLGVELPTPPTSQIAVAPSPTAPAPAGPDIETRAQLEHLTTRITQLEADLRTAAEQTPQRPNPDVSARLETLERTLEARLESDDNSKTDANTVTPQAINDTPDGASLLAALEAAESRLDAAEQTLETSADERAQLKKALATVTEETNKRTAEFVARFDAIKTAQGAVAGANSATHSAALGLAINGLDAALASDKNFILALNTTKTALNDAAIAPDTSAALTAIMAPLEDIATTGAPSLIALTQRYEILAPTLARRESVGEKSGWINKTLNTLYDVVSWRRIDGAVERASQALRAGDLINAVAHLSTAPETSTAAKVWIADARTRIAVNTARNALKSAAIATQIQTSTKSQSEPHPAEPQPAEPQPGSQPGTEQ